MAATPIRVQQFLQNLPLFSGLAAEEIDRLASGTAQVRAPSGTLVFRRGDPCNGFHVIVYGQIKLALAGRDGSEKVVEVLGPGQSFGEAVMFLEQPYVVFAEALTDTLLVPFTALRGFFDPSVQFGLTFEMGGQAAAAPPAVHQPVTESRPTLAIVPEPEPDAEEAQPTRDAEVVSLDAFRKKN
jgi:hypothetical protein